LNSPDPAFADRRMAARARLDAIDPHRKPGGTEADPLRRGWFEAVYDLAGDDPAQIPWADLKTHPLLAQWLSHHGGSLAGKNACDVGCGLGDNAEALAAAGARVTAFDLVPRAIKWARRRFPQTNVRYKAADLFALPGDWHGSFDFVHECYTLQALPRGRLPEAARALAKLLAPGGRLLVIARAAEDETRPGPPWPLTRHCVEALATGGLSLGRLEDVPRSHANGRHWRVLLAKG
jgi:2-polyprenyl-3-methyl-5-hydroxy-6-metoxy-1,4-benzoquinol methylase